LSNARVLLISNESELFRFGESGRGVRYRELSEAQKRRKYRAEDLLGGRLREVVRLKEHLSSSADTHLVIVTYAYGVIDGDRSIEPYEGYCTDANVAELEDRHAMTDGLRRRCQEADLTVVCLPNDLLEFFLARGAFPSVQRCVFVASASMHPYLQGCRCSLTRRGARVGRENVSKILDLV